MSEPRLPHIHAHTGLRGVAALLVVTYHLQFGAAYRLPFETMTPFFERCYLFVDLFFVLSGFIISYTADAMLFRRFDLGGSGRFLLARLIRIWPLHLFCLAYLLAIHLGLAMAFAQLGRPYDALAPQRLIDLVLQALLMQAWLPSGGGGWNVPSWSISAELVAYAAFPVLALILGRCRGGALALLFAALSFYLWIAATTGDLDIIRRVAVLRCLAGFALGMVIFRYRGCWSAASDGVLSAAQVCSAAGAVAVLATASNDALAIPAFALLVAGSWPDRGIVARLLASPPLQLLGKLSYSVYLNHVCLMSAFSIFASRAMARVSDGWLPAARLAEIVIYLIIVLAVSLLTFRLIEEPARRALLSRLLHRRARLPTAVPTAP